MIIVILKGGLGNQMFQYSLYQHLKLLKKRPVLYYYSCLKEMKTLNRCNIFDAFKIKTNNLIISIFFTKLFMLFNRKRLIHDEGDGAFSKSIFSLNNIILDGYWQSYKYFENIRPTILNVFNMSRNLNDETIKVYKSISNKTMPVSVHLRFGDYLTKDNEKIFGGICTKQYYLDAFNYLESKFANLTYFVFSNDIALSKKFLKDKKAFFVDINDENEAWNDLFLMSNCKANIIANSSFSWWGAWLNTNDDKVVIAPKKWFNGSEALDICPPEWIRL